MRRKFFYREFIKHLLEPFISEYNMCLLKKMYKLNSNLKVLIKIIFKLLTKMKSIVCVLFILIGLTYAQPEVSGTGFLIDNILKPLLNDIKENSLSFLQQMLLGMIPGIGKRDVYIEQISSVVQNILNHASSKFDALNSNLVELAQLVLSNIEQLNGLFSHKLVQNLIQAFNDF